MSLVYKQAVQTSEKYKHGLWNCMFGIRTWLTKTGRMPATQTPEKNECLNLMSHPECLNTIYEHADTFIYKKNLLFTRVFEESRQGPLHSRTYYK